MYKHPDALFSIYRCYVGCQYPGAAADRPQRPRPAEIPVLLNGAGTSITATPGSTPLSVRLGTWSGGWETRKNCNHEENRRRIPTGWEKRKDREKCRWAWPLESHGAVQIGIAATPSHTLELIGMDPNTIRHNGGRILRYPLLCCWFCIIFLSLVGELCVFWGLNTGVV